MRRSGLQTVRRVADLREAGARTAVAAATRARAEAERVAAEREAQLAASELPGGRAGELIAAAETRSRSAVTSMKARRDAADAEVQRREAIRAWTAAARRTSVLGEAVERQRLQTETARHAAVQRTLDDLAARGRTR